MLSSNTHKTVTVIRDTVLAMPELWLEIYVAGDRFEQANFAEMFVRSRCTSVGLPEDADVVVFTGGPDVNPALYGEDPHPSTHCDIGRDTADMELYQLCLEKGIPMFGVCRGAQFLHVMNGGRLYQDVDKHNGDHTMYDIKNRRQLPKVSSVHHQMCIKNPDGGMEVLATSMQATEHWRNPVECDKRSQADVEAYFYRETCCFGVQGHPEYRGYSDFARWTLDRLNEFILENPDIELKDRVRRMKPDLIAQRTHAWELAAEKTIVLQENEL